MRWAFTFAVLFAFLVACAPVATPPEPAAPAPQPTVPVVQPVANATEPLPAAPEENETAEPDDGEYERPPKEGPSIAKFLDVFHSQVKNYKFTYKNDIWMVQGKAAKMIPFREMQNVYGAPIVDAIYFDLERRTATGVCEGIDEQTRKQCASRKILGSPYTLPYVQFMIKLPEEWLTEYQTYYLAEAQTPRLNTDREVVHLKYLTSVQTTDLYIDPASGLPVAAIDDGIEYHYEKLSKNSLKSAEKMVPE